MNRKLLASLLSAVMLWACMVAQVLAQPQYWDPGSNLTYFMHQGYRFDKNTVSNIGKQMDNNDDVSACLRFARDTGINPASIRGMRHGGQEWQSIMKSLAYEPHRLYEGLGIIDNLGVPPRFRDTFRKYDRYLKDGEPLILTDEDVRDLVQLRFCIVTFGVPVGEVFRARARHDSWTSVILNQGRP